MIDCAERGIAQIQPFNTTIKDTIQKEYLLQYILQVVEQHWKLNSH